MTEPDPYSDSTLTTNEIENFSGENLAYLEYPPYDWAAKVGYTP
jgi:hypothetical protein